MANQRAVGNAALRRRLLLALALGLLALLVIAYRASILREEARQLVIDIPAGTAARLAAGDPLDTPPHRIEMVLGVRDVLIIRNADSAWHEVGPYRIAPGHTLVQRFSRPGVIRQACTMTSSQQVEIVIRER